MESNPKALIIMVLIIIGLFAGGLYYLIQESKNQALTLEYTQELINTTNPARKTALEMEIKRRLQKRPLALTSKASFDSFELLITKAQNCDRTVKTGLSKNSSDISGSYYTLWTDCMKN